MLNFTASTTVLLPFWGVYLGGGAAESCSKVGNSNVRVQTGGTKFPLNLRDKYPLQWEWECTGNLPSVLLIRLGNHSHLEGDTAPRIPLLFFSKGLHPFSDISVCLEPKPTITAENAHRPQRAVLMSLGQTASSFHLLPWLPSSSTSSFQALTDRPDQGPELALLHVYSRQPSLLLGVKEQTKMSGVNSTVISNRRLIQTMSKP